MAGSSRYTAVLDANVLYPALLRDLLLSLAHADLYSVKWSRHIRDEWTRSLLGDRPGMEKQVAAAAAAMEGAIPVLAAAIAGHADAIVTWNEKDFPAVVLDPFGIEVQSPDEFVLNQVMLHKTTALGAIKRMRLRWERPQFTRRPWSICWKSAACRRQPRTCATWPNCSDLPQSGRRSIRRRARLLHHYRPLLDVALQHARQLLR